jgi:hypothetical protein
MIAPGREHAGPSCAYALDQPNVPITCPLPSCSAVTCDAPSLNLPSNGMIVSSSGGEARRPGPLQQLLAEIVRPGRGARHRHRHEQPGSSRCENSAAPSSLAMAAEFSISGRAGAGVGAAAAQPAGAGVGASAGRAPGTGPSSRPPVSR